MNVLSIDLESWLHKHLFDCKSTKKNEKDGGYICEATLDILKILKNHDIKTTFFVVSEVFDWHPWLIYKIKDMDPEIGFHTYSHRTLLREKDLLKELKKGKEFIDEFNPLGFRAPETFVRKEYFPILRDWGVIYDSSIYSEFKIFKPTEGILEVPVSTYPLYKTTRPVRFPSNLNLLLLTREIPFGSGYSIGLLGSNIQWFIRQMNKKNIPTNLFVHTWQIKDSPILNKNIKGNILRRVQMIPYNINRRDTVDFLFQHYEFLPMNKFINSYHYVDSKSGSTMEEGKRG